MSKVIITKKGHPHFGECAVVIKKDEPLSMSFLGTMDRLRNDNGKEFFAKRKDYKFIRLNQQ